MCEVTIDMTGLGRAGIIIPSKRIKEDFFNDRQLRQYYLGKVYEAGGPAEKKDGAFVLTGEVQISQDFVTQDVTITWKLEEEKNDRI